MKYVIGIARVIGYGAVLTAFCALAVAMVFAVAQG